jgi:hypothetical protein
MFNACRIGQGQPGKSNITNVMCTPSAARMPALMRLSRNIDARKG